MAHTSNRDQTFWQDHNERYLRSSLKQRDYCEQQGLPLSTFQWWRRRLALNCQNSADNSVELVALNAMLHSPAPQEPTIRLVVGGGHYRLEIRDGVQEQTLRAVLNAIEARP